MGDGGLVRQTVGIAEVQLSNRSDVELITHALGSCLGVTIHDADAGVGGMIHIQLPLSKIHPVMPQAVTQPPTVASMPSTSA